MSVNPHVLQYLDGKLAATGSQALPYDEWSKPALRDQLLQLVERYPSLSVRDDPFTHNDGRTTRLLRAEGTVPIYYQGVKYNIPVKMFLPEGFPRAGPICYVTPTANMIIKPGHGLVDGGGLVRRDPSGEWRYPASALADFVRHLADAFGVEPPLFAKPPGYEAHPSPPAPQERADAYARNTRGEYRREAAAANGDARGAPVPYRGRGQPPPPPPPGPGTREHSRPGASRYPSPPRSPRVVSQYPPQPGAQHGHAQHGHGPPPPPGAYPPPPPPPASARGAEAYGGYPGGTHPQPPPGVSGSRPAPTTRARGGSSRDGDANGRSLAEATFKSRASKALTARLKRELAVLQTTAAAEAERLLGVQAELARRREALEAGLREMRAERARWEGRVGTLRAATVQSEEWLAERARRTNGGAGAATDATDATDATKTEIGGQEGVSRMERCDAAFAEEDDVSRQLLRAVAKDAALEDAMDALDEGLDKGVLKLPEWLRATRKLSKEQFMARAETLVVRKTQTQRGVSGGVTFRSA